MFYNLMLLIAALCATSQASAYNLKINGIYYNIDYTGKTASVARHSSGSYSGVIVIPETIICDETTYSVTSISEQAFRDCTGLTSVTISNSVTTIGNAAFMGCTGLTSVTIGNSVTSIGRNVFRDCTGLTSVTIPNSVTSIGNYAFSDCTGLTSLTFNAEKCSEMGAERSYVFRACTNLANLTIGDKVTIIPEYAFLGCTGLTSIVVDKNNGTYDSRDNCNAIIEISTNELIVGCKKTLIPNSVTSIGRNAFLGCTGLSSVTIPNSVTSIGDNAFGDCTGLHSLIIGAGVLSIGEYAIGYYYSKDDYPYRYVQYPVEKIIWLTNTPPEGYSGVEAKANYVANSLYSKLSNIYEYKHLSSYFEVDGIRYVPVSPSERTCDAIDCTYNPEQTDISLCKTVLYKGVSMTLKDIKSYTCYNNTHINNVIVNYEGNIGNYAFNECSAIVSTDITVESVGNHAFFGCSSITNADITAKSIGDYAFQNSATINDAIFKISANTIEECAFSGCSAITSADITVKSIGDYAFGNSATTNDAIFKISANTIGGSAFSKCSKMTKVLLGESLTQIGESAFSGCSSLEGITIPNNVESIGQSTFEDCSALSYAKIGSGIKTIPAGTFCNCSSLPSITIPKNVAKIEDYAFDGCLSLADVYIEDREDELRLGANGSSPLFSGCPLKTVYIGGNITYSTSSDKGYSPFYRNTSLEKVIITDKETEISENEFYGCTGLKYITMGDGIEKIGDWAFSGCSSLDFFRVGSNVKTIGKEAFSDCTAMTKLITTAPVPPSCGSQALDDINKWTCELLVNKESIDQYKAAEQWKEFFFISEYDGVDDVSVDTPDALYEVYNLQGVRVGSSMREAEVTADTLPHGVYILVSPQSRKKLKI